MSFKDKRIEEFANLSCDIRVIFAARSNVTFLIVVRQCAKCRPLVFLVEILDFNIFINLDFRPLEGVVFIDFIQCLF